MTFTWQVDIRTYIFIEMISRFYPIPISIFEKSKFQIQIKLFYLSLTSDNFTITNTIYICMSCEYFFGDFDKNIIISTLLVFYKRDPLITKRIIESQNNTAPKDVNI